MGTNKRILKRYCILCKKPILKRDEYHEINLYFTTLFLHTQCVLIHLNQIKPIVKIYKT